MVSPAQIIRRALVYIGTPYRFGAEVRIHDLQPASIDCSELAQIVYNRYGIMLPDGSYNQIACPLVRECSVEEALRTPAALLFHRSAIRKRVDHVGISDGEGGVIEATPPRVRHKKPTRKSAWFAGRLVKGVHY